jgi:HdeA/HdeB family
MLSPGNRLPALLQSARWIAFTVPTEVTLKLRLFLTGTLFLFAQASPMQAQETVDVAKITCEQLLGEKLARPSRDIVLWLSGYYAGKRNNTITEPQTIKKDEEKVNSYCYKHPDMTIMDAVKNVLGFDK